MSLNFLIFKGVSGIKNIVPFTTTIPTTTTAPTTTTTRISSVCNFEVGYNYPQMDISYRTNITLSQCCNICASILNCQGFAYMVNSLFCSLKGFGFQMGKREPYIGMISGVVLTR